MGPPLTGLGTELRSFDRIANALNPQATPLDFFSHFDSVWGPSPWNGAAYSQGCLPTSAETLKHFHRHVRHLSS